MATLSTVRRWLARQGLTRELSMPYIDLPEGVPGIRALIEFRPEMGRPLLGFVEALLRGPSPLSRGERELIASYVSRLNSCSFCEATHSAFAAVQLDDDWDLVESVKDDLAAASVSEKMRSLLALAAAVQRGGTAVTQADVDAARAAGANDVEIHDAVLISAAFCSFNRYVDGLGTWNPSTNPRDFLPRAEALVEHGYLGPVDYAHYQEG
jgi:uncharacterized peroxidase-related enzyme